ncbi:MAG: 4-alpha-glucanotransferase [Prosthecobacter sp.]|jgi:4-alpha-glucanotransferase|uniref:4-alpha-glucanotransferase n=1 Tax=Prosthecobacter sp. TaxID=1965333 RepID=UPI001A10431E|nr:4-alpha-glucanotransferase [Prosthecobacter sp.]MBE2284057.1 4-alpha-glucanotransferase [Prosthecobacter sp.]
MPTVQPRRAGVLIPVFAIRTPDDLGIGDTGGVRQLIDWAADTGLGFVQFLPINATGSDSSPYNAISSVALDYLTLELTPAVVPELDEKFHGAITGILRADLLRHGSVNYPRVRRLKTTLLRRAFSQIESQPARLEAFEQFCVQEAAWLDDFCLFKVLMEEHGHEDWANWRENLNTPAKARAWRDAMGDEIDHRILFHAYVQWLCFSQWRELREHANGKGIKLMGDIPFGISWCSADVFFRPEQFDLEWCGGAPPETYFKDDYFVQRWGQNWGIPLYRWDVMAADGFQWWRQRTQKLTEVFDIFRIDHVLGFYRIYSFPWRPLRNAEICYLTNDEAKACTGGRLPHFIENADDTPEHKAENLANGDKYLRAILAAAGKAEVVAEDLGTVPDYVRPHLLSLDVPGFKVSHWEDDPNGRVVMGSEYDNCAFTTYATHDHEPMKTLWEHRRHDLGSAEESDRAVAEKELRFLSDFAGLRFSDGGWPAYDDHIRRALLEALLSSNARFAAFMLTDLFGLEQRFNVPGIAADSNWSARLPMTMAEIRNATPWKDESAWLKKAIQRTER